MINMIIEMMRFGDLVLDSRFVPKGISPSFTVILTQTHTHTHTHTHDDRAKHNISLLDTAV